MYKLTEQTYIDSGRRIIAAASHVLTIGVNRLLDNTIVIARTANTIISIVLVEVESRRTRDALPEVSQSEIEILPGIDVVMFVSRFFIFETGLVHGRPSSDLAEATLCDTPSSAQHLYSSP